MKTYFKRIAAVLLMAFALFSVSCKNNKKAAEHAREVMAQYKQCVQRCYISSPEEECHQQLLTSGPFAHRMADCQDIQCVTQVNSEITAYCKQNEDRYHSREHCVTICDSIAELSLKE